MAAESEVPPLYPLFLDLNAKPCLVVGAGEIAHQKVAALLRCGAEVTVTAIDVIDAISALAAEGKIRLNHRPYEAKEAGDYYLVIAATSDNAVNTRIHDDAHAAHRLVNVVDVPHLCDFHVPAIVRRGKLQVAISTAGSSPSIAKRLKREIDDHLSPHYGRLMDALMVLRNELKESCPDSLQNRMKANANVADSAAIDAFLDGDDGPLKELIEHALAPYRNQS